MLLFQPQWCGSIEPQRGQKSSEILECGTESMRQVFSGDSNMGVRDKSWRKLDSKKSEWRSGRAFPPGLVFIASYEIQQFSFVCNLIWIAFLWQSGVLIGVYCPILQVRKLSLEKFKNLHKVTWPVNRRGKILNWVWETGVWETPESSTPCWLLSS